MGEYYTGKSQPMTVVEQRLWMAHYKLRSEEERIKD